MNIRPIMFLFRDFLNKALPTLNDIFLHDTKDLLGDWMQANWEIVVEAQLGVTITHYAGGADCNTASSRVWQPDASPTHHIICRIGDSGDSGVFYMFVSSDGHQYTTDPPLNYVITRDWRLMDINHVEFELKEI